MDNNLIMNRGESSDEEDEEGEDEASESYEVESIEKVKGRVDNKLYLVKWKGWEEPTWEPAENLASSQEILDEFLAKEALKPKKTRKSTGFWAYAVEGDDSFVQPIHEVIPTPQVVSKRRVPMVLEELFGDDVEAVVAEEEEVEVPVVKPKSTTSKRPRVEDTPSPLVVDVQLLPIVSASTSIQDRPLPTKEIETSVTDFSTYSTKQLLAHHNESQTELSPEPFGPKPSARKKPRSNSKTLTSLQSSSIASTSKIIATPKKARVEEAVIIFVEYSSKKGSGKGKKAISWSLKGKENEVLAENVSVSEKVVEIVEKPVNDVPKSYSSDNSLSLDIRTDTAVELEAAPTISTASNSLVVDTSLSQVSDLVSTQGKRSREVPEKAKCSENVKSVVQKVVEPEAAMKKVIIPARTNSLSDLLCVGAPGTPSVVNTAVTLENLFEDDEEEEEEVVARPAKRVKTKTSKARHVVESPVIEIFEPIGSLSPLESAPAELPTAPTSSINVTKAPVVKFRPINKNKPAKIITSKPAPSLKAGKALDSKAQSLLITKLPTFRRKGSSNNLANTAALGELGGAIGATNKDVNIREVGFREVGFRESQSNFGSNAASAYDLPSGILTSKGKGKEVGNVSLSLSNTAPIGIRKTSADSNTISSPSSSNGLSATRSINASTNSISNLASLAQSESIMKSRSQALASESALGSSASGSINTESLPPFRSIIDIIEDESRLPFETPEIINSEATIPANLPVDSQADLPNTNEASSSTASSQAEIFELLPEADSTASAEVTAVEIQDVVVIEELKPDVPMTDVTARLKSSKYWQRQIGRWGREELVFSAGEALGLNIEVLVTLRGKFGGILRVTENMKPEHVITDDEAECLALKLVLGQVNVKTPAEAGESLDFVFIHRSVSSQDVANELGIFFSSNPHTQFYQFGSKRPVERIFSYGFAIVPTLSSIAFRRDKFNSFWKFSMKYPTAKLSIHPATLAMARHGTYSAHYDLEDVQDIERMLEQGDLNLMDTRLLDPSSPFYRCTMEQILAPAVKGSIFSKVDEKLELLEIEGAFSAMIALRPKQTRRFILASEDLERDSKIIKGSGGIELLNFENIIEVIVAEKY